MSIYFGSQSVNSFVIQPATNAEFVMETNFLVESPSFIRAYNKSFLGGSVITSDPYVRFANPLSANTDITITGCCINAGDELFIDMVQIEPINDQISAN